MATTAITRVDASPSPVEERERRTENKMSPACRAATRRPSSRIERRRSDRGKERERETDSRTSRVRHSTGRYWVKVSRSRRVVAVGHLTHVVTSSSVENDFDGASIRHRGHSSYDERDGRRRRRDSEKKTFTQ